ncbi:MAG: anthranilate synthase component I family protein, partial [Proteiniphilum sp.]|nr:anthranilate synthase component I family protein [Proteiniphilum sp.]
MKKILFEKVTMMQYKFQTNSKKIMGDLHTPVSVYLKVRDTFPQSALLESSDFHANENSISYLALKPIARVEVNRGVCHFLFPDDKEEKQVLSESFTISDALNSFVDRKST